MGVKMPRRLGKFLYVLNQVPLHKVIHIKDLRDLDDEALLADFERADTMARENEAETGPKSAENRPKSAKIVR